jgi:cytochrome c biogenesis protein CcmG/thiol:disulfide interchange protein DsbE
MYGVTRSLSRAVRAGVILCLALGSTAVGAADALNLERFRGKVVVVDFWASWCKPCRESFPWLNAMQAQYGSQGLVVVGVNVDRTPQDAARFLREVPAQFEIVYDPDGAIATRYEVPGMPSSYVFDPAGKLLHQHIGFRLAAREEREAELKDLLAAARAAALRGSPAEKSP